MFDSNFLFLRLSDFVFVSSRPKNTQMFKKKQKHLNGFSPKCCVDTDSDHFSVVSAVKRLFKKRVVFQEALRRKSSGYRK